MKRSAISLERTPLIAVTIDSLERRLVFVKKMTEWFHQYGVNVDVVERHLRILVGTSQHLKENESVDIRVNLREEHEKRKREVWELLSKFYGMVLHQRARIVVAFKLVGDINKFDEGTLQVVGVLREMKEEESEEVSEEEEGEDDEVSSEYMTASWERLERTFPSIQSSLWQLKQHGMDTSIYRESFDILTYTIWRLKQEEVRTEVEVIEERFKEEKKKLKELLDRLDEFLAGLIRPWEYRL